VAKQPQPYQNPRHMHLRCFNKEIRICPRTEVIVAFINALRNDNQFSSLVVDILVLTNDWEGENGWAVTRQLVQDCKHAAVAGASYG
jgi:hypothetical protein